MKHVALVVMVLVSLLPGSISALAQSTSTPPKKFDAASVKLNRTLERAGGLAFAGDRLRGIAVTLEELVRMAYGDAGRWLPDSQIVGGPAWMRTSRYDINARADAASTAAERLEMLREMLADRFGVRAARETRDAQAYRLVVHNPGQLGPEMKRSDGGCSTSLDAAPDRGVVRPCGARLGLGPTATLVAYGQTPAELANTFSRLVNRSVIDATGLAGRFDAQLTFTADGLPGIPNGWTSATSNSSSTPELFTAIREQLGLRLEPTRAPVDVIVIERASRPRPD